MSTLKDATIPELQFILQLLLDTKPLNDIDRFNIKKLRQERTYSRAEKQLIESFAKKYNLKLEDVTA